MDIKDLEYKLKLHIKDYEDVRKDMDKMHEWAGWFVKIILGAVIVAILSIIGLSK